MICRDESLNADAKAKAKSMKYLISRKKTEPRYNAALLLLTLLRNKGLWHSLGLIDFLFQIIPFSTNFIFERHFLVLLASLNDCRGDFFNPRNVENRILRFVFRIQRLRNPHCRRLKIFIYRQKIFTGPGINRLLVVSCMGGRG